MKAALLDRRRGESFSAAYSRHMAAERAQDREEARRYGLARTAGIISGTVAQLAALGPAEAAIARGARIRQITRLVAREKGALGALGAAGGVGGQAVSDVAHGRVGTPGDYVGAALGGTVQALASLSGRGGTAGAAGGAATSLAQDVANGRLPSLERARLAASEGAILGTAAGASGRAVSNRLPNHLKGRLGELMSKPRTWARGERVLPTKNKRQLLSRSYTIPDHWTSSGARVESKFGSGQRGLKGAQLRAYKELPAQQIEYRVDHWLPQDVGAALAYLVAQQGYFRTGEQQLSAPEGG